MTCAAKTCTEAQQRLLAFDELTARIAAEPQHADDAPFWQLTISAGRHSAHAIIAWARECLAALDDMDSSGEENAR